MVVGLVAPPLLASVVVGGAVGGLIGKFTKHRLDNGIEEKVGMTIPKGSAGVITLVDQADTAAVKTALSDSLKTSVIPVDSHGIKALKEGLADSADGAKSSS